MKKVILLLMMIFLFTIIFANVDEIFTGVANIHQRTIALIDGLDVNNFMTIAPRIGDTQAYCDEIIVARDQSTQDDQDGLWTTDNQGAIFHYATTGAVRGTNGDQNGLFAIFQDLDMNMVCGNNGDNLQNNDVMNIIENEEMSRMRRGESVIKIPNHSLVDNYFYCSYAKFNTKFEDTGLVLVPGVTVIKIPSNDAVVYGVDNLYLVELIL